MSLGQNQGQNHTDSSQHSKQNHNLESAVNAGIDDLGRDDDNDGSPSFDESDSNDSDLGWIQLVDINCVNIEGVTDDEFDEEDEEKDENIGPNVSDLSLILVPDKNQHEGADCNHCERNCSLDSPRNSLDGQEAQNSSEYLS